MGRLPAGVHQPRLSYYKISQGNMDFFLLDSDNAAAGGASNLAQRTWLKQQISASTARWKFGVWHHPPFSSGASHGSHGFIQWGADFQGLHAIFTGHDHIYERLNIGFGVAQFILGIGGKSFYNFSFSPVPTSVFRYNANHGALRVVTGSDGVQFDFLAIGPPGGTLIDSYTIGTPPSPVFPSGTDTWSLPVQRGSSIQLGTRTPPAPGPLQNPANPMIQLLDHTGVIVATDAAGALDGRNARLVHTVPESGENPGETLPWTVRVLNEAGGTGEYELRLTAPSLPAYQAWAALQPMGFPEGIGEDPDFDGSPNLMEYLLDSNPAAAALPPVPALSLVKGSSPVLQIALPSTWTRPVTALLQSSPHLIDGTWTTLAVKSSGATSWLGSGTHLPQSAPAGGFTYTFTHREREFYRLAFVLE